MATPEMVEAMVAFASEILDNAFIKDPAVRREVATQILQSERFLNMADQKFNLQALLDARSDPVVPDSKPVIDVYSGANSAEKTRLVEANPDVSLRFHENTRMPHAAAFSQRMIDTDRLMSRIPLMAKTVIDIGGNYLAHAHRKARFEVHCCTLKRGHQDWHRQMQREVAIENGLQAVGYCVDGVETCDVHAPHGISVHAMQKIDPSAWPDIFQKHALEVVDGVYHFDPRMVEGCTDGYIMESAMHWKVAGDVVSMYFDMDSSDGYTESLAFLLEYAHPWVRSRDDSPYAIVYQPMHCTGGNMYGTLRRMEKITLGYTPQRMFFTWLGDSDEVDLPVPEYDPHSGYGVMDRRGYTTTVVRVPRGLYEYAYYRGFSNDTDRPDLPITKKSVADAVRVHNVTRSLNGVPLMGKVMLAAEEADRIALGIYLQVVTQVACSRVALAHLTEQMKAVQRKWGGETVLWLLTKSVCVTMLYPLIKLSDDFSDAVSLVTVWMRTSMLTGRVVPTPQYVKPVHVHMLKPEVFCGTDSYKIEPRETSEVDVPEDTKREFYLNYRMELDPDVRKELERQLYPDGRVPPVERPPTPVGGVQTITIAEDEVVGDLPTRAEAEEELALNREAWLDKFQQLQRRAPEWAFADEIEPEEGTDEQVFESWRESVLEYALYCFDLELCTRAGALDHLKRHWIAGVPNDLVMKQDNVQKDIGAAFYRVQDGYLSGVPDDKEYDVVIDPVTREFIQVVRKEGGMFVGTLSSAYAYTLDSLRIMNSRRAGLAAMRVYRTGKLDTSVKFELINGIAGSGKTRAMMREFTIRDTYTTGPRAAADKQLARMLSDPRFKGFEAELRARMKSNDAFTLNAMRNTAVLRFDEGLMTHCGVFFVHAIKSRTRERVVVSGDDRQIPLVDRGSKFGKLVYSRMRYWHKVTYLNESDRSPADVIVAARELYPQWRRDLLKTRSPIRRSLSYHIVPDVVRGMPPLLEYEHVNTFKQDERSALISAGLCEDGKKAALDNHGELHKPRPVLSVHESQGDTFPVCRTVRTSPYSGTVYGMRPHQYVTSSRHTILGAYYTPRDDEYCSYLRRGVDATEVELDAVQSDTPDWLLEERYKQILQLRKYGHVVPDLSADYMQRLRDLGLAL